MRLSRRDAISRHRRTATLFLLFACIAVSPCATHAGVSMPSEGSIWSDLPLLPEALGGQCVGASGAWLLVAGGSSWTAPMWSGGIKRWSDRVYGLRPGDQQWTLLGHLPYALGYAAAATWNQSLLCAGGENGTDIFRRIFQIEVNELGRLQISELPALPEPRTLARAAVAGDELFVIGGQPTAKAEVNAPQVLMLSLRSKDPWKALQPPWKKTLVIPEVAACNGSIMVAGGAEPGPETAPPVYVRNAWSYDRSRQKWSRLPELPNAVAGGGSVCTPSGEWVLAGGDDGALASQIQTLREHHPGFPKAVYVYSLRKKSWSTGAPVPVSLLGSGAVVWNGLIVLPGGEDRPGHRSNRVLAAPVTAFP